ncbi:sensor domain-containing diguanylate cyclase, partial [Methylobacterium goesingense]
AAKAAGRNRCAGAPRLSSGAGARRVLKAGLLSFDDGRAGLDCTVRSLSEAGAALNVVDARDVPETFRLSIRDDRFSRRCRIALRRDGHLDVAFV